MSLIKKKKHVSKKNKKDWRKHCDIRDVEDFLDDQRLEERLGKFSTKPDSELFVVDTVGDDQENEVKEIKPILSTKQRKRAQMSAVPKCFEILLSTSKVVDPNAKRNHVNPFGVRPTALSKISEQRREVKGVYAKRLDLVKKDRQMAFEIKKRNKMHRQNFHTDMWTDKLPEGKTIPETLCDDFISQEAVLHNVLPGQRLRPKPPLAKKLVATPAVTLPHPGVSYNPAYQEHQELLQDVVECEQKMMQREAHLHRVTTNMFTKVTALEKEKLWQTEMSIGLPNKDGKTEEKEEDAEDTDQEYKAINPPVKNKKKDHKARRKQKERLVEKERLKQVKINKQKITDLYKLRKLQSNITKTEERQSTLRSAKREKQTEKDATKTPLLSSHKVAPLEPDFVEPASLSGDLRNVACTTNLLRERYESLQRRGAIAGSKLMMKKMRKCKSYFKSGHKVTDEDVERYLKKNEAKK